MKTQNPSKISAMMVTGEGSISAPFFLIALIILLTAKHGPLTWPGAVAAGTGVALVFFGWKELALADALFSAAASFTAQSILGVCLSCTCAAIAFALAGIILVFYLAPKKPLLVISLAFPLAISLFLFADSLSVYPNDCFEPVKIAQASEVDNANKPVLYYSPWCSYCEEPLALFIKRDPIGETWQPVVVPYFGMTEGEKLIRELGYQGKVISASKPPSGALPCLVLPDGRMLSGKSQLLSFVERSD